MPSTAAKVGLAIAAVATGAEAFAPAPAQLAPTLRGSKSISAKPAAARLAPQLRGDAAACRSPAFLGLRMAVSSPAPKSMSKTEQKMYDLAQDNFRKWNQALVQKDPQAVANLYCAEDLSFLPTVSPNFIKDSDQTLEYFEAFVQKQPMGTITQDRVQSFDSNSYLHTGMYTFGTAGGPVQARFSYMWRQVKKGQWKIIHHHSSVVPSAPAPATPETDLYPVAQENFQRWNSALKEKDYEKVAAMYCTKELSFLPTVSPEFIRDPKKTQQYFVEFIKKQPEGTITSDNVQKYGNEAYLHSGMYTFMTGPEDDRQPVEARFSYMWRVVDGVWKIVHHHSSAVPKPGGAAANEAMSEKMYPVAQENFKRWNDALKAKDYDQVASLYSKQELSFLPTVSPEFIKDGKKTRDYFVEFIKKQPEGTIMADDVQAYGPDAYLHTGMYTFMTGPEDARAPVDARFSYMWRKVDGEWKIVHHHSSATPKTPAGPIAEDAAEKMYPVAQLNFKRWNDALKAKDYKKVASLYSSKELSFLPTVSPEFIKDGAKTEEYFINFVQKLPDGTITADDVQPYGPDSYLHTGMYTFMTGPEEARQPVEARFSYMWRIVDGSWKIVHHHSSAVPKAPGGAAAEIKAEKMYPVAQENFKRWNDALKAKDFDKVAALYSNKELSFLPTVSPEFIKDGKKTKDYFVEFIKKQPEGTITADDVQPYGPDAYLHTGMYTFMTGPEDARAPVEARFSYMWRIVDGSWKIVHHHSSAVPKAPAAAEEEVKAEKMYPVAQENFKRWNDALKQKDYEKVASLYSSEELSFLPTVSPEFIKDGAKTRDYFVEFIKKQPEGTITADDVQPYGNDAYLHTGMYTFMTGPKEDRQPVDARFSYMWRKVDGAWKIVHHHSSAVPKAPGSAVAEDTAEKMYPIAQENFKRWNDGLKAKDYKKVASMYSKQELSFLPTVSPEFIKDGKKTEEYFVEFIKKQPEGTITADDVQPYGPDAYLHTGMYTFMTGPEDARAPVEARFSYMWRKIDGEWKIVHHHSSAVPKAPGNALEEAKMKQELLAEEMYPVAQDNFKMWNDALLAKDYEKVASLYDHDDLSFLPTVSPKFIQEGKATQEYFMNFLQKLPDGTITADKVQPYGKSSYLHTGMYTFMTGPEDDRQPVNARFSYMWKKSKSGEWKIVHHHSSAVPAAGAPAEEFTVTSAGDPEPNMDSKPVVQLDNFTGFGSGAED